MVSGKLNAWRHDKSREEGKWIMNLISFRSNKTTHLFRALAFAFLLALAGFVAPAYACGCGVYVPSDGDASVMQERSLVRWDGQHEDIVMSLGVLGQSKEAAIILPVPAKADVTLADAKLFDELDEMTKPLVREETEWGFNVGLGASAMPELAAGAAPVTVLSRQDLGPFDVANLAATDSTALKDWLDENGFQLDPRIPMVLQPYVEQGWTFVAVRLQPEQATQNLSGALAPLRVSFDASELVYPMRASAIAKNPETLNLYVLADHRVEKNLAFGESRVSYADWIEPSAFAAGSALAPYVPRKFFLTKYIDTVNPVKVHDDFKFTFAAQDTPFREVRTVSVKQDATGLVLLGCFGALILGGLALLVILFLIIRRTRRPQPAA